MSNIHLSILGSIPFLNILNNINGISISPKKNFCIVKIWMRNKNIITDYDFTSNKDPFAIHNIFAIEEQICVFKQHK